MKAVMVSIQPKWVELIVHGQKTIEVRRNRPKLETPFKVYIYCTQNHSVHDLLEIHIDGKIHKANGMVIGEFTCDDILRFDVPYPAYQKELEPEILKNSCLTYYQLHRYAYHDDLYGWRISNLVIYDQPKELSEFRKTGYKTFKAFEDVVVGVDESSYTVKRPPQSWCYVEELEVAQ